jgi:hypothetical protein
MRHPCKGLNITIAIIAGTLLVGTLLVQPLRYSDGSPKLSVKLRWDDHGLAGIFKEAASSDILLTCWQI